MKKVTISIVLALGVLVWMTSCEKSTESFYEGSAEQIKVQLLEEDSGLKIQDDSDEDEVFCDDVVNFLHPSTHGSVANLDLSLFNSVNNSLIATTKTDNNGYFWFYNIQPGTYTLTISDNGTHLKTVTVTI